MMCPNKNQLIAFLAQHDCRCLDDEDDIRAVAKALHAWLKTFEKPNTIFVCIRTDCEGRSEIITASENESAMDEYRDLLALENQAFGLKYGNPSFCVQDIDIDEDAFQSNLINLRSQKEAFEQKIAKNKREHVERQTKDLQQRLKQLDSKLADLLKNKQ